MHMQNVPFLLKCEVFYKSRNISYSLIQFRLKFPPYKPLALIDAYVFSAGNAVAVCLSTYKEHKEGSRAHKERIKDN